MVFDVKNYADFTAAIDGLCNFLLARSISSETVFDSKLVAYELLGNVLQHSGGGAALRVELADGRVHLCVVAEKVFQPPKRGERPAPTAERGRGLYLVDELCESRTFTDEGGILVKLLIR